MAINRINETDLRNKLVSQLSNRPTDPRTAGGDNMTAQEVKARHDALGLLVKDKLNELLDALNNATVNGEPVTPLSDLITVVADNVSKSLTEWIEAKLTKNTTAGEGVHAYGVDDDGEQTMLPVSDAATEGAIPQYGTGGVLPVADGTEDGHAMNKGQVDALVSALTDAITAKYTKPDGGIPLTDLAASVSEIISDALKWSNADASATPGKLVMRDLTGVAHGATYGASAVGTALVNKEQFEPVKALAEGASQAAAAENYSALVGILSEAPKTKYKAGQRFLIGTYGVPDVGVLSVEETAVSYTYTTDGAFEASLMAGTLQIGYFVLRPVEGKTNLEDYSTTAETNEAISDAIDLLVDALVDGVMAVAEATYAESATYAQQADFANQINTDREIEDADTACPPVLFGTVGGNAEVQNGLMKFPELRGNTIEWNQLIKKEDLKTSDSGTNFIMSRDSDSLICTITVTDTIVNNTRCQIGFNNTSHFVYVPTGHKYLFKTNNDNPNIVFENGIDGGVNISGSGIVTQPSHVINRIFPCVILKPGLTAGVYTVLLNIHDLTDIYGAGKEPSTVAEFTRDYPLPYYANNAGTLLSSKSSSVDFVKRNQLNLVRTAGTLSGWENTTPREFDEGKYYAGLSNDGYYAPDRISNVSVTESSVSLSTLSNGYGIGFPVRVIPGQEYILQVADYLVGIGWYDADGNHLSNTTNPSNIAIGTAPSNAYWGVVVLRPLEGDTVYTYTEIQFRLYWSTPNLPYVAYSKQTITLPNIELRSVGDVYDVLYQSGGGKRRIGERAYQEGDEDDPDVLTDGTTTLYVLETETDITLEENPGWTEYAEIDNFGTVRFNQSPAQRIPVPQAYFVRYTVNLVEFLDSLYVHCGGDVTKLALVEQLQATASE